MSVHYFAYGSNLCRSRLVSRATGAESLGAAALTGYRLRWHKRSVDGSGKCSVEPAAAATAVYGVVYRMSKVAKRALDRVEGVGRGYDIAEVQVRVGGVLVPATTYVADPEYVVDELRPYAWYRELVVRGAVDQGLPEAYVASLRGVETWKDPDADREVQNLKSLPCAGAADRGTFGRDGGPTPTSRADA